MFDSVDIPLADFARLDLAVVNAGYDLAGKLRVQDQPTSLLTALPCVLISSISDLRFASSLTQDALTAFSLP